MQPGPVPGNVSVIPNVLLSALTATKHRRLHLRLQMHQSVVQIPRDDVRKRTPLFFSCFSQRQFVLTCFFLLLFTIQTWIFPLNYKKGKYIFTHTVISPALSLSLCTAAYILRESKIWLWNFSSCQSLPARRLFFLPLFFFFFYLSVSFLYLYLSPSLFRGYIHMSSPLWRSLC